MKSTLPRIYKKKGLNTVFKAKLLKLLLMVNLKNQNLNDVSPDQQVTKLVAYFHSGKTAFSTEHDDNYIGSHQASAQTGLSTCAEHMTLCLSILQSALFGGS